MYDFNYQRATSVDDAASKYDAADDARYLAGGMTMVPVLKQRLDQPSDVVDLGGLDDLRGISEDGGAIVVKAMTTHHEVNTSDLVKSKIPALAELAGTIGDPMVRNRGTIGGSLANNDPAASYPAAVLGLGATIQTNKRSIEADDYFTGMFETALEEGELITAVSFPVPEKAGYKHFPNPASRYPIVGAFVAQTGGGVRVGITGAAPCAYRQTEFEEALAGGLDPESLKGIDVSADGMNSDIHASSEYRAHLVNVMARRAIGG
ncbi:MAG: xanthine dehydrogenase family protein subunit M [Rhodospirillales bacterium]|jgi:carbon-monoxide dehydrogenase medium subunit|nr:xanthine dehydrogenase family protein subunit M [Rhodospirillales bacterium]MDP6644048.1 xanthine dehydrogenase family protein subunit M [Rhodospirillales bacterium]MDP6842573.1 xanthine dehydrogenase family protein subunit M [Rhodospirillales bacterium]|tara:strand:+ start:310 stop:1098 length:789 start_codon:yes stop_codon:yes gene_type:complete